ncbi:glycoside hydrolase family 35 protein [Aspergillus carbonarius ITEM 5010]|uniref:Beta-galactosidase n=1 Tax=Aspergillus carbonarius (strain ITEM 5010) TaxID=602072 RepID=A0A1R3S1E1_ASPC5|nr:glycoside hydrolase family 35 protein [Aspergillus carbonarius ITEM 5010]
MGSGGWGWGVGVGVYVAFGGSVPVLDDVDVDVGGLGGGGGDISHEKDVCEALVRTVAVEGRVFGLGAWGGLSAYGSGGGAGAGDAVGDVHSHSVMWKKRSRSVTAEGPHEIVWPEVHPRDQDEEQENDEDEGVSPGIRRSITAEGPHEIVWPERHADEEMVSPKRKEEKKPGTGMGRGRAESAWMVSPFGEMLASNDGDSGDRLLVREIDLEDCIRARWDRDEEIVTWDDKSLFVYGERVLLLSGEFHPFRLPSPGLWLDVFQKVRAIGYSAVSFYVDWALLEGQPGHIRTQGVFDLEPFFAAAQEAGLYLIARPGPYINAEVSGGGFPGWLQRLDGPLKRTDSPYLDAITPYIATVGEIIARAQITNGGPVILVQAENEYTLCMTETGYTQMNNETVTAANNSCLETEYMAYVEDQYRQAGIVVPLIVNDAEPLGDFAPGTGVGAVDIYSFDFYPLQWSTAPRNASDWSSLNNPLEWYNYTVHEEQSPTTPVSISEFQGGVPDAWGGVGVDTSAAYIGPEFERVFYKLNYGYRVALQNLYMIFGGTNWGNLGHPGGYTSYDVGAAIMEDRQVIREKYSELKLQAGFLQASPAYLISQPDNGTYGVYTNSTMLATTRLHTNTTNFYMVRHGELGANHTIQYTLQLSTSIGDINIPQLGGSLSLHRRDSKIHVVDYDVGGINLIYSTAEVFSWKKAGNKSVLILYGGEGETHEFAVPSTLSPSAVEGDGLLINSSTSTVIQWSVQPSRRVVHFGDQLEVHLLWRNEAYNYWVLDLPLPGPISRHSSPSRANSSVIIQAGYLLRTASITGPTLTLTGDLNATTELEIIAAPSSISTIRFNNQQLTTTTNTHGRLHATVPYQPPAFTLPSLSSLPWHFLDSLPELHPTYNDTLWTPCNHTTTRNPRNLTTPTSLYSSDYGYNTGSLLYRGTFTATGSETALSLLTEGGYAYGHSIWLNSTFLSSWPGSPAEMFHNQSLPLPALHQGEPYTFTILIDHMGNDENFPANGAIMKDPRGILDYTLHGRTKDSISWKVTGNLGGEAYLDHSRGPLNEGGLYVERMGYHLPGAPIHHWKKVTSPTDEVISTPGVGLWATHFDLDLPLGYDIPLSVVFTNTSTIVTNTTDVSPAEFRAQIFINGWQFGKYVNHIGPQTHFPIPEGILNYNGSNYLAVTIWAMDTRTFQLAGLEVQAGAVVKSAYRKPGLVRGEGYVRRIGEY